MDRRKLVENIILFNSCADLSIKRFDIIYRTGDLRYLCIDFNGYNDIEAPKEAESRWKDIFDEWVKVCDDRSIAYYYQLILEVAYLETRYHVSKELIGQIYSRYPESMDDSIFDRYVEELAKWKYIYDKSKGVTSEVIRLLRQHKASKNKLNLKKSELESLKGNFDDDPQTLEKQAVILEQITGRNNIDIDTTCVLKWVEICKIASMINEQRKRHGKQL